MRASVFARGKQETTRDTRRDDVLHSQLFRSLLLLLVVYQPGVGHGSRETASSHTRAGALSIYISYPKIRRPELLPSNQGRPSVPCLHCIQVHSLSNGTARHQVPSSDCIISEYHLHPMRFISLFKSVSIRYQASLKSCQWRVAIGESPLAT